MKLLEKYKLGNTQLKNRMVLAPITRSRASELVAFGSAFLANPDLPQRFEAGAKLNDPDYATFYSGGEKG